MDYEQLQQYQKSLLDRALSEGIRRNDEQSKIWFEYKERHEKVIEGLETFQKELAVDCMVPIGKKALMRGKLTHTNEILVSLGEGYFAKYSAAQAISLCNRRIERATNFLEGFEKERNLFEMRQRIPESFDAFGGEERKDLLEHWDNDKLNNWRLEHRRREKEYRKKLSDLKNTEKQDIQTEEDLFKKLDALELQEELEDELLRLEAARPGYYEQDLEDGEIYEESESESSSDPSDDDSEEEAEDNNDDKPSIIDERESPINSMNTSSNFLRATDTNKSNEAMSIATSSEKSLLKSSETKISDAPNTPASIAVKASELEVREKKVVFGQPEIKYFSDSDKIENISQSSNEKTAGPSLPKNSNKIVDTDDEESDGDDVIRINVEHSDYEPEIVETEDDSIQSPKDIYKMLLKPKSILKKSSNHVTQSNSLMPPVEDNSDEETEDNTVSGVSAYNSVVKEIREHVNDLHGSNAVEPIEEKRPISKFKRERATAKK